MKITKILNNNVVISKINGEERIVMGVGIAFGKKNGQAIEKDKIDKIFRMTSDEQERMLTLIKELDDDVLLISQEIIVEANKLYKEPLSESIYIALTDHINYAIKRHKEGTVINNPLLYEIKRLYPDEYKIGLFGIDRIAKHFNLDMPKDEAGFIAMHIVNANMNESISNVYEITKITQSIVNLVRYHFNLDVSEEELSYARFITHLKFFSQRLINFESLEEVMDISLLASLQRKYSESNRCVDKIGDFLKRNYNHDLSNDERVYLILHIARLLKSA
ncbi:PRD domain-containing protein [Mammaliicoccus sciuri]|uniref:BglG family transcription antiterminator LicT n=1 Tax=Mammaliicoccus sciuri TaxID=1296 RepID=UPI0019502A05|nr:PRD domain-containing protein [Mammaliicoccus sciuri]MEB6213658.1 PRD domain-containing protein [Mammaliicoccus sciuri]MEB6254681.1 PRD domain-containing protein [Mammaliicoccus sciuri]MEB6300854.1 PRD domain-containing protein [Mammaliicoccus sciuri]MEB6328793.1 PRD domain-containing protein [Mammaliicoccus sciuri]MEB6342019.1 PRD domain-containing protein [Mammaliicoccus sciuri]